MDEIDQTLTEAFRDVFDDDTLTLTPEMTSDDILEWDSLAHVRLMLAVQTAFKIKFSATDWAKLQTVGALQSMIRARL